MIKDIELISKLNKDWQLGKIKVKEIKGHTTNRNWIVEYKKKKFFVRLPWERSDIVNREVEAKNVLVLAECQKFKGVVPRFFLYVFKKRNILDSKEKIDLSDGTMVMEYIEGKDIDGKDLEKSKIQDALLQSLYAFHSSGVKFANVYDIFRDELEKYRKKAKKYPIEKILSKNGIKKIEKIEKMVKGKMALGGGLSTHNDLIFTNLRLGRDGKIYILDFEYAGYNIREGLYYDLGIILGGNLFYKKPITFETFGQFLKKAEKKYKRKFDDEKIYCGALANVLVMFWWGMVKYFSSKTKTEKKYFKDYILKRARGIELLYKMVRKDKA